MPPKPRKRISLLDMVLRSGRHKNDTGGATSSTRRLSSSTPLYQSLENLQPEREGTHPAENCDVPESETQTLQMGGMHTVDFSVHPSAENQTARKVQFQLNPPASEDSPISSSIDLTVAPLSWDTFGLPESYRIQNDLASAEPAPLPVQQPLDFVDQDLSETPPTRIVTPDIQNIERGILEMEVEMSAYEYTPSNPFECIKRIKEYENELKVFAGRESNLNLPVVGDLSGRISDLLYKLQGVRPRVPSHRPGFEVHRDVSPTPNVRETVTYSELNNVITDISSQFDRALSVIREEILSEVDSKLSISEARIVQNVKSSLLHECEAIRRDCQQSERVSNTSVSSLSRSLESLSLKINTLESKVQRVSESIDRKLRDSLLEQENRTQSINRTIERNQEYNLQKVSKISSEFNSKFNQLQTFIEGVLTAEDTSALDKRNDVCASSDHPNVLIEAGIPGINGLEGHRRSMPLSSIAPPIPSPRHSLNRRSGLMTTPLSTFQNESAPVPEPRLPESSQGEFRQGNCSLAAAGCSGVSQTRVSENREPFSFAHGSRLAAVSAPQGNCNPAVSGPQGNCIPAVSASELNRNPAGPAPMGNRGPAASATEVNCDPVVTIAQGNHNPALPMFQGDCNPVTGNLNAAASFSKGNCNPTVPVAAFEKDIDICSQRNPLASPGGSLAGGSVHNSTSDGLIGYRSGKLSRIVSRISDCANSITLLVSKDVSRLTKSQVMEISSYDLKSLHELCLEMKELEKKLDSLHIDEHPAFEIIESSLKSCKEFKVKVDELKRKHFLHLSSDKSMLKKLELEPFDGSPEKDTVYNFLSLFFRLTEGSYSPIDQAAILYTTYLSDSIKKECESFKNDIYAMHDWLIRQYGDLRMVVDAKLRLISKLRHPVSTTESKIEYFKLISQLILHVESLSNNEYVNSTEIKSIIYNSTLVKSIVSVLPAWIITRFSKLLQAEPRFPLPSGERYFQLLKTLIDTVWRELDTETNIRNFRDYQVPQVEARKQRTSYQASIPLESQAVPDTEVHAGTSPEHCTDNSVNVARTLSFPCTFHGPSKMDHELGQCRIVFSMSNKARFNAARRLKLCFSCFKPDCLKVSPQVCISNVPQCLICPECSQSAGRRIPNVLFCTFKAHTKPNLKDLESGLTSFLKVLNKSLLQSLVPTFNLVSSGSTLTSVLHLPKSKESKPKSKSSPADPNQVIPQYDTQNGTSLVQSTVMHESVEDTVYIFQSVRVKDSTAVLFYDSGATGHCVRGQFAEDCGFKVINPASQRVGAFGNQSLWTDYGLYKVILGSSGSESYELVLQGISSITGKFPAYNWSTVNQEVRNTGKLGSSENLPLEVGGSEVDILIGMKTPELVPKLLFCMPSGLGVFRCQLTDLYGSTIAYGGSHSCITQINKTFSNFSVNQLTIMFSRMACAYSNAPWCDMELSPIRAELPKAVQLSEFQSNLFATTPLVGTDLDEDDVDTGIVVEHVCKCHYHHESKASFMKARFPLEKKIRIMDSEEDHLVTYRCKDCEDCIACKSSPSLQSSSLRERAESVLISESVRIALDEKRVYVKLPFLTEPNSFFRKHFGGESSNYNQSEAVFFQQCRKSEKEKEGIRKAMSEFIEADFAGELDSAPLEIIEAVKNSDTTQFYPWRAVYKESVSTPVRLVVDPSSSHLNLNVAKGYSGIASLHSILMQARASESMWTSDVRKLYNCMHLELESIPYSLFLYHPDLDPNTKPKIFYMKRAWYGIRSTGSQATEAFRKLAEIFKDSHPAGARVLQKKAFVDDLLSGTRSFELSQIEVQQVTEILSAAGFSLKFVAYNSQAPPPESSLDSEHVHILGYSWAPLVDRMFLKLPEVNFQRKRRGVKPPNALEVSDSESIERLIGTLSGLTRRHVVGKSGECFDPLGIFEPFKAALKRALSPLSVLGWNEKLSLADQKTWTDILKLWPELAKIYAPRSVIPEDVVYPLETRLICLADASADCGGACLYLSFKLKDGSWSSRILMAKSRLLKFSVPRNELEMIELASELIFSAVVTLDFNFKHILLATDSVVAMAWCLNERIRHKVYVMNRVLAVNRFLRWSRDLVGASCPVEIVHISGAMNVADLLTKGPPSLDAIRPGSVWQEGVDWMKVEVESMPLTRYSDISLTKEDTKQILEEIISCDKVFSHLNDQYTSHLFIYHTNTELYEGPVTVLRPPANKSSLCMVTSHVPSTPMKSNDYLIDVIDFGWARSNFVLKKCVNFCVLLMHKTHMNTTNKSVQMSLSDRCPLCIVLSEQNLVLPCRFMASEENQTVLFSGPIVKPLTPDQDYASIMPSDMFAADPNVGSERAATKILEAGVDCSTQLDSVVIDLDLSSILVAQTLESVASIIVDSYWNEISTVECLKSLKKKDLLHYELDKTSKLLFYKGRVGNDQKIAIHDLDLLNLKFFDGEKLSFHSPCVLATSDIFYAFAIHCHFNLSSHAGYEGTLHEISKRFHVINPRKVLVRVLKDCIRCKRIKRKALEQEMAKHNSIRFTFAPPFTFLQVDIAQPFHTKTRTAGRQTTKAPCLVVCCLVTGGVGIYMMEDWTTESVIHSLTRHGSRYGMPSALYIDSGSQLQTLKNAKFDMQNLGHTLLHDMSCQLVVAPPKSHVSQGRVERKIGIIKDMLLKLGEPRFLMSFLAWETLFSSISNSLNDLPIARASSRTVQRPEYSVLTVNRLLVGRNNSRALAGPLVLDTRISAMFERSLEAQETFFKLLRKQLTLLIPKSKWYTSDEVFVNDFVLFYFDESNFKPRSRPWHFGKVVSISGSRLTLEYTLGMSNTKKLIERSKRNCCRIANEEELDYNSHSHFDRVMN